MCLVTMESSKINVNYNKEHIIFGEDKTFTCEFNKKHLDLLWNNKLWPQHCQDVEKVWPCCKFFIMSLC